MKKYADVFPEVKKMTAYLFGDQVSLSYPMPDVLRGLRVERFFLYPTGSRLMRSRPFGILTVEMESGRLVSYRDCRIEDFMDTEKFPFQEICYELPEKVSVRQFKETQNRIHSLYESVREFAFGENLTDDQKALLTEYWQLLLRSVPVSLQPYYQEMGKAFYTWLTA